MTSSSTGRGRACPCCCMPVQWEQSIKWWITLGLTATMWLFFLTCPHQTEWQTEFHPRQFSLPDKVLTWNFFNFFNSNRRIACSRSLEMHQQDNIISTWWLRIIFLCQNGSKPVLVSPPWAPSLCTSRWLVRASAKYGNKGGFIVFLIPCRCNQDDSRLALPQGESFHILSTRKSTEFNSLALVKVRKYKF